MFEIQLKATLLFSGLHHQSVCLRSEASVFMEKQKPYKNNSLIFLKRTTEPTSNSSSPNPDAPRNHWPAHWSDITLLDIFRPLLS